MKQWFIRNLLDTPEGHWLVIYGYHIHKSFWGVLFIAAAITLGAIFSVWYLLLIFAGLFLVGVDIAGHIYTNHRPLFVMVEKHSKVD